MKDRVIFKLDEEKVIEWAKGQGDTISGSLKLYCERLCDVYNVNITNNNNEEVIITGKASDICALIVDGHFLELTVEDTEKTYDEQHGREYLGMWEW